MYTTHFLITMSELDLYLMLGNHSNPKSNISCTWYSYPHLIYL